MRKSIVVVRRLPRLLISGALGGLFAGAIAGGVGGRIAMRIVSLMGGRHEISLQGSVGLLVLTAIAGALLGVGCAILMRVVRVRAIVMGLVLMVLLPPFIFLDSEEPSELLHQGEAWANVPMFFGLILLYGVLTVAATRWIDARLQPRTPPV